MRRLGCLVLIALLIAGAWVTRDRWLRIVGVRQGADASASAPVWEPLGDAGANRTARALERLGRRRGPVFATLSGADVASYIYRELSRQLPPSTDSVEAAVFGDRLYLRASVELQELGGGSSLGAITGLLGERERIQLSGGFHVIRPGLAEYRVREVRLRDLSLPSPMIPRLVSRIGRGARPEGMSPDGLPLAIPAFIADIRVAAGKITLYKTLVE